MVLNTNIRNHVKLNRLQVFAPIHQRLATFDRPYDVPLEILVDYRCEHDAFQRLLPQTDAKIQYDKFNRLRLRNESTMNLSENFSDANDHMRTLTVCSLYYDGLLYIAESILGSHHC